MYSTDDTPSTNDYNELVNKVLKLIEAGNQVEVIASSAIDNA